MSLVATLLTAAALAGPSPALPYVDLNRYQGQWFEIAAKPQSFAAGCTCTQAEYTVRLSATRVEPIVDVVNTCWRSGIADTIRGTATLVDPATTARLAVQFPNAPLGAYVILAIDPDYRFAVVAGATDASLWILARERQPDASLIGYAMAAAAEVADLTGLRFTDQRHCPVMTL